MGLAAGPYLFRERKNQLGFDAVGAYVEAVGQVAFHGQGALSGQRLMVDLMGEDVQHQRRGIVPCMLPIRSRRGASCAFAARRLKGDEVRLFQGDLSFSHECGCGR